MSRRSCLYPSSDPGPCDGEVDFEVSFWPHIAVPDDVPLCQRHARDATSDGVKVCGPDGVVVSWSDEGEPLYEGETATEEKRRDDYPEIEEAS